MRIDPEITRALDATGLPWRVEQGSKHAKLYLGPQLVGVLPHDGKAIDGYARRNTLAQIRRAARAANPAEK